MLDDADKQWIESLLDARLEKLETSLLRAFSDYNSASHVRMRKMEADVSNIDASTGQRLGHLEEQITRLETRVIALEGRTDRSK